MPFVYYYAEKKHKEDLPSPVSSKLDDCGSMGVAKIGTDVMPV